MYCVSSSKYPESTIKRRGMDRRVDIAVTNHFSESALVVNHRITPRPPSIVLSFYLFLCLRLSPSLFLSCLSLCCLPLSRIPRLSPIAVLTA